MRQYVLSLLIFILISPVCLAADPDELLADPELEERARILGGKLRCVVCKSQSIEDSDAPLAKDMRVLVRERIENGQSDQQVIDFLVERYGDYVLLHPPVQQNTFLLWFLPGIFVVGAAGMIFFKFKPDPSDGGEPLSADELKMLDDLVDK